jgi:hypothetical protein
MLKFLAAAAVAVLFVAALPRVHEALPEGRLKSVVQLPGTAVSRMEISGADPLTLLVAGFVAVLLLVGLYALFTR